MVVKQQERERVSAKLVKLIAPRARQAEGMREKLTLFCSKAALALSRSLLFLFLTQKSNQLERTQIFRIFEFVVGKFEK